MTHRSPDCFSFLSLQEMGVSRFERQLTCFNAFVFLTYRHRSPPSTDASMAGRGLFRFGRKNRASCGQQRHAAAERPFKAPHPSGLRPWMKQRDRDATPLLALQWFEWWRGEAYWPDCCGGFFKMRVLFKRALARAGVFTSGRVCFHKGGCSLSDPASFASSARVFLDP